MGGNAGGIVRRPAVPRPIRIRRNAANLPANHPILAFYGSAINAMKAKPLSDPTSWRYQAAIHDYVRADDPFAISGETIPSDSGTFWAACEHHGWFFLPWHRMYLHHFEMIVLSEVIRQGGPTDWALPYWNYSASTSARILPAGFQQGSSTGLFVDRRDPDANGGRQFMGADSTNIDCLREPLYTGVASGSPGFGGLHPPNPKNHGGGPWEGLCESAPHDLVHGALNGNDFLPDGTLKPLRDRGFMGNFTRAPLDPIFWVHHCNIDRLWEVWVHTAGHSNPTTNDWLTAVSFSFHDATGAAVSMTPSQVVDTRAAPLFYEYDDIGNPFSP
jgi:tyrosinase